MMLVSFTRSALLVTTLSLALFACKEEAPSTATSAPGTTAAAFPASLRVTTEPGPARGVAETRAEAQVGQRVTVHGVVGSQREPIAANRAILTLLDTAIPTCDRNPDDHCRTPWDACCEPASVRAANALTVQVVDAEGQPLRASLADLSGVRPLAQLTVTGTLAAAGEGAFVVHADGIYVAN